MKEKVPQKNEKTSWNQNHQQKFYQKNKYLSSVSCKIIWKILKMDKGETQKKGPKNKEIDVYAQDKQLNVKTILFPTIQFSIITQFSSI